MNNEKKIIDKIISDANTKAEEILTQARSVADEKIHEAEQKAQKEIDIAIEAAKIEAVKAKAKEMSSAEMTAKKKILTTKQQLIEQTIKLAKKKLLSYSSKENETIILSMLKQAGTDNTVEVIVSPKDKASLKPAIEKAGYKLASEIRDISGGFILKKGEIEYNYSFESIIAVQREELEQIAAQILFS